MAESSAEAAWHTDALEDAAVCTVADLNDDVGTVVESAADLHFDYVVGDVTDYRDVNGNVHFDLDYDDASIHCIVFGYRRSEATDDLEAGTQIAVAGDLSYYEARGNCSILVTDVVELGDGTYRQEYRENRRALAEDGLFDEEYKQSLPPHPETVGIVTSLDSDAREDAVTSIHDRHPGIDVVLQHATVQGDRALPALLEAISTLDRDPEVSVIVVTRGGGADTTLRVFDEVALCRVIFETDTPVVVGIGHERDRTLADEVADERVMTPTHVGSIVPERESLREERVTVAESLDRAYERTVARRLETAATTLDDTYEGYARTALADAEADLEHALSALARERLTDLENRLDHAVEAIEREERHEREKEATARDLEASYARRLRVHRVAIAVLLALAFGLAAALLFAI